MKLKIKNAEKLSNDILKLIGFKNSEAKLISNALIEADLAGKSSHGLSRLFYFKRAVIDGISQPKINLKTEEISIKKETSNTILVDGKKKCGFVVLDQALKLTIKKAKNNNIVATGLSNTAPMTGCLGHFVRIATENNLIYIGFNNSPGRVAPHGTRKKLWGTNPINIGIPTNKYPIIHDMSTAKITVGGLLKTLRAGGKLPKGVAIDDKGNLCTDPQKVFDEGSLLPIAGYKGSGLALICELLAGALTGSRAGFSIPGGWGTFFILINPTSFKPLKQFKKDIDKVIKELKKAPKQKGVEEVFYPGERSMKLRDKQLKAGTVDIDDTVYSNLQDLIKQLS
ncbi:MAG: Ldh family oxidoreductase [Patescibacteria group bacterium]|nr:Ldh family oxidoreductase [Patescibacteria group bacterium]